MFVNLLNVRKRINLKKRKTYHPPSECQENAENAGYNLLC